jgi:hypothetical protein
MNTEIQNNEITTGSKRRNGNVARLPKVLRDKINSMLDDGAEYSQIIAELEKSTNPPLPHTITEQNITRWKDGGYQDYLRDQAWREQMTTNADRFLDLAQANDGAEIAAGGMQAALIQICQLMDELFNPKSGDRDAASHVRVANTLSRLSRSIISLSQYRDDLAKAKAADPESREAHEEARRKLVEKVDELFGLRRGSSAARVKQVFALPGDKPVESNFDKNHIL